MTQLKKDKATINNFCELLGVSPRVDEGHLKTFYEMQWDIDNEVHVFAFISYLTLINGFKLSILSTSNYPENVIEAINTFKIGDNDYSLHDLLIREFLRVEGSLELANVLANFTLTLTSVWELKVNKKIF